MSEHPVVAFLEFRRRDRTWDLSLIAAVIIAALVGVAQGTLAMGLTFGVTYALLRAVADSLALASLCKNRCIEEILLSRTGPGQFLDGFVRFSLRCAAKPVALVSLMVALLAAYQHDPLLAPALAPLTAFLLVPPLTYAALLFQTSRAYNRLPRPLFLLAAPALLEPSWVTGAAAVLFLTVLARRQAAEMLREGPDLSPKATTGRAPNPWLPGLGADPIALREHRREARRTPLGWLGALLHRHGLVLAVAVGLVYANTHVGWSLALTLLCLQPLRAAARLRLAVLDERESGSFEALGLTQLHAEEFVDGWARVGYAPRMLENLALAPLLLLSLGAGQTAWGVVALLLGLTVAGAYAGLWASAVATNRSQTLGNLLSLLLFVGVVLFIFSGIIVETAHWLWFTLAVGTAAVYVVRNHCLSLLKVDAVEPAPTPVCRVEIVPTTPPCNETLLVSAVIAACLLLPWLT